MSLEATSRCLKAAADPTRLRLLAILSEGDAAVGELQAVLGQSQPRVSRHLKILTDAGLVERFRDGHWIYCRLASAPAAKSLVDAAIAMIDVGERQLWDDRAALADVKRSRRRDVYGVREVRARLLAGSRPDDDALRSTLEEALGDGPLGDVLDIGCGLGSALPVLSSRARLVVGVDVAQSARLLARSRVHELGLANCTIRAADLRALPFGSHAFDLVVLDEVLSADVELGDGLAEALRVLRPGGQLLIIDRIQPVASQLGARSGDALADNQLNVALVAAGARIVSRRWLPGRSPDYALFTAAPGHSLARTGSDG
jgi:DNA-binding transcriptional ArsR family regulator